MKKATFLLAFVFAAFFSANVFAQAVLEKSVALTPVPRDTEQWWVDRHAKNVELMGKGNIDLLLIGDSITHGWDNQKQLWEMYYAHRKPINLGFSGDRTEHVLWRLEKLPLGEISPKAATIMIGTNNIGHGSSSPKETVEGIKAIVNKLQKTYPEMKILVLSVFPRDHKSDEKYRKQVEEINSYLPELLKDEKNVTLMDIGSKFLEKDGTLPKDLMPDFLHPNAKGYGIWARSIDATLSKLLGETNPAVQPSDKMGEEWWRKRHEENVAQTEQGNVGLLMIGDSITHGWDGQKEIWDKTFGSYNPINLGFGGDQTQHVLWRLDNLPLDKISPKSAEIMIGTNNTGNPHNTPYQIAVGIKAIVEKLQKQYPEMKVVVLSVFPRAEQPNDIRRAKVNEINACLPDLLGDMKNVQIVDLGDKFLAADDKLTKDIMPDFLHLSKEGYQIWADAVAPVFEKIMK